MTDEHAQLTYTVNKIAPPSCIVICPDTGIWAIKITKEGIKFNHELYPNATPHDFAAVFMDILERCYDVKFLLRERGINE